MSKSLFRIVLREVHEISPDRRLQLQDAIEYEISERQTKIKIIGPCLTDTLQELKIIGPCLTDTLQELKILGPPENITETTLQEVAEMTLGRLYTLQAGLRDYTIMVKKKKFLEKWIN